MRCSEGGALDEVRPLLDVRSSLADDESHRRAELTRHLRGEIPLDEAVTLAEDRHPQYIKRQQTWWRGQMADWRSGRLH